MGEQARQGEVGVSIAPQPPTTYLGVMMQIEAKRIIIELDNGQEILLNGYAEIDSRFKDIKGLKIVRIEIQQEVKTKKSLLEVIKSIF